MIKDIDRLSCINCGLCDYVCQMDVFRFYNQEISIEYPDDCYNCLECLYICPTDAIIFGPGVSKKFDIRERWQQIKEALDVK